MSRRLKDLYWIAMRPAWVICAVMMASQASAQSSFAPFLPAKPELSSLMPLARTPDASDSTAVASGAKRDHSPMAVNVPPLELERNQARGSAKVSGDAAALSKNKVSQFQRFVEESTGQWLKHYGEELFERADVFAADATTPPPADYKVGVGDEVRVQIWGAVDYVGSHIVDRQGQVFLPKIGAVTLAGVAVKDLETQLRKSVSSVFNNVNLNVSMGRLRGITVYVVGQARQPGTYTLSSLGTLVNALFASGGPDHNGSMRAIELKRAGKRITTLDLYDFLAKGDKANDLPLQSGDVIVIPPAGPRVAVTGAWDHAAIFELKPGQTLQDVLALGGGLPRLANAQKAVLERIQSGRTPARMVQDISLQTNGLQLALEDGDVITLLGISPAFENAVTLKGAVAQPLRHAWIQGMRIQDLIPSQEALIVPDYYKRQNKWVQKLPPLVAPQEAVENASDKPMAVRDALPVQDRLRSMRNQINWEYAVVERLHKDQLRSELISFNLGLAILSKDPAHNLLLQPGDVVTIMSSSDLRLPVERQNKLVRIEGEVASPGVYQVRAGETLPQLIARIGGLTPQAYLYGTEFTRESIRKQQQANLDAVVRRLESQVLSAENASAANLLGDRAAQSAVIAQAQQQQMKAQLDKIKAMKSLGRLALELTPVMAQEGAKSVTALPSLPLEDGDAILIPTQPAFVSAAGSVNNENAFIYKPGKTVGDIIKSVGLTEDAEPNEIFVLRADGSILGKRSSGFLKNFDTTEVMPGDTVVVPAMLDRESRYNFVIRAFKDWTQILSNFGLGVASLRIIKSGL
jgi:protein involved in polysaccharide export with SLBB domain